MPPFSEALMLTISSSDANLAYEEAKIIALNLKKSAVESKILGPVEAEIFKKNDTFYFKIQVLAYEDSILEMIRYLYPKYQSNKKITLDIERI
jgi:primosomal protein N'